MFGSKVVAGCKLDNETSSFCDDFRYGVEVVMSLSKRKNLCQNYLHKNSDLSFLHAPKDSRCFHFEVAVA